MKKVREGWGRMEEDGKGQRSDVSKFCLVNNCQQNIFYVFPIFVCLQILIVDEWKCK